MDAWVSASEYLLETRNSRSWASTPYEGNPKLCALTLLHAALAPGPTQQERLSPLILLAPLPHHTHTSGGTGGSWAVASPHFLSPSLACVGPQTGMVRLEDPLTIDKLRPSSHTGLRHSLWDTRPALILPARLGGWGFLSREMLLRGGARRWDTRVGKCQLPVATIKR